MYISELTNLISLKLTECSNSADIATESKLDFLANEFLNLNNLTVQDAISFFEQALLLQLSKKLSNSDRKKLKEFKNQVIEQIIHSLQNALYSLSADFRERHEGKIAFEQRKKEWLFNLIKLNELAENNDINVEIKKLLGAMIPVLKNQQSLLVQLIFMDEALTKPIYLGVLNGRTKEDALASVQTVQGYTLFRAVTFFVKHPEKWKSLTFEEQAQWLKYISQWKKTPRTEMLFNTFINNVIHLNDIRENLEDEIVRGEFTEEKKQIFIKNQIIYDILAPAESLKLLQKKPEILTALNNEQRTQWICKIKETILNGTFYLLRLNLVTLHLSEGTTEYDSLFIRLVLIYLDTQKNSIGEEKNHSDVIAYLEEWKMLPFEIQLKSLNAYCLKQDEQRSTDACNEFKKVLVDYVLSSVFKQNIIQSEELPRSILSYLKACKNLAPDNENLLLAIEQLIIDLIRKNSDILDVLTDNEKQEWINSIEKTIGKDAKFSVINLNLLAIQLCQKGTPEFESQFKYLVLHYVSQLTDTMSSKGDDLLLVNNEKLTIEKEPALDGVSLPTLFLDKYPDELECIRVFAKHIDKWCSLAFDTQKKSFDYILSLDTTGSTALEFLRNQFNQALVTNILSEKFDSFEDNLIKIVFTLINDSPKILDFLERKQKDKWIGKIIDETADNKLSASNLQFNSALDQLKNPLKFDVAFKELFLNYINAKTQMVRSKKKHLESSAHVNGEENDFEPELEGTDVSTYRPRGSSVSSGRTIVESWEDNNKEDFQQNEWHHTPHLQSNTNHISSTAVIYMQLPHQEVLNGDLDITDLDNYCEEVKNIHKRKHEELPTAENSGINLNSLKEECRKLMEKQQNEIARYSGVFTIGKDKKTEKIKFLSDVCVQLEKLEKNSADSESKNKLETLLVNAEQNPKINDGRTEKKIKIISKEFGLLTSNEQKVPTCMGRLMACFG